MTKPAVHVWSMLALTFSTGIADAVGFLALDRVFTGNMTGNVVILGMAVASADNLPVLGPAIALLAFMFGAAASGVVLRGQHGTWPRRTNAVLAAVAAGFSGCGLVLAMVPLDDAIATHGVTAVLASAMGAQAGAARHIAVKDVTTVVVTSTITGLAFDSRLGAARSQPWLRRAGAIGLIGAGAVVGTLLLRVDVSVSVFASAAITVAVLIVGCTIAKGD